MRMLAVDRRQERALGGSIGEGSKQFTDGIHVSGQPGTTVGITVGHEAQGDTDQPGTKQVSEKPAGDSKLDGVEKAEDQRLHSLGEQECGARSGWRGKYREQQAATQIPQYACQGVLVHPARVWAGDRQP